MTAWVSASEGAGQRARGRPAPAGDPNPRKASGIAAGEAETVTRAGPPARPRGEGQPGPQDPECVPLKIWCRLRSGERENGHGAREGGRETAGSS